MTSSGIPWKYRYQYLSAGVNTGHGWRTWNQPDGQFATYYMDDSAKNGYIPMFSYYQLLQSNPSAGPDERTRDYNNLNNPGTMNAYFDDFKTLMQKAGDFKQQVVVQVEPDLWGYLQQTANGGGPQSVSASVSSSGYGDVGGYANNVQGFAQALIHLRDTYAPNVVLAAHASPWAASFDIASSTDPGLNVKNLADQTANFLDQAASPASWDAITNDLDDHDAGWQEQNGGHHWWDPTNQVYPNFARYLAWVAELHAVTGKPQIAWQVPVGNQYFLTMNNTCGHYQDNVAQYFLNHTADLFGTGLVAVLFGAGNSCQTTYSDAMSDGITNNNGQSTTDLAGWCNSCNNHVSTVADDDGGYLRMAVGQYYASSICTPTSASPPAGPTDYFAEGFTGTGFDEQLALFTPGQGGTAYIDFYTESGHSTCSIPLQAGKVGIVDVNQVVGLGHEVSARVTLPAPGVAERLLHFQFGQWYGSTDIVGAAQPASEWDFAEGSTLSIFDEYLTLQNPTAQPVTVDLDYFTDVAGHPTRSLTLAANTRTTVEVFSGNSSPGPIANCVPKGSGASCGVGRGIPGVSVQVKAEGGGQIVAERPFYVNGFSFGSGAIAGGHVAFGATAPGTTWNFAEGTTLAGFNEFLSIQNPNPAPATVTIQYLTDSGTAPVKTLVVGPMSRSTVQVWDSAGYGAGMGIGGVSAHVTSDQPVVVERPMYVVHDFGGGTVAGATDVVGSPNLAQQFSFAHGSTTGGEFDYLTVQDPGPADAGLTITYYTPSGTKTVQTGVGHGTRLTIHVWDGAGTSQNPIGITISSTVPVLVEKPTYSANSVSYGATDTLAGS
jgi:hypothetical protein